MNEFHDCRKACETDGRTVFFHLFSIDAVSANGIDHVDVELPNGNIVRYDAPLAGEALSERAFQSIAAAKCIGKVKRPWIECVHCGYSSDALIWASISIPANNQSPYGFTATAKRPS